MLKREMSAPPPGDDPNEFIMSDSGVDRMGDVIDAKGWTFDKFKTIALFNHDRDQVIGEWKNIRIEGDELRGNLHLAEEGTSARINEIRSLVRQGILRAVSVGFQPIDKQPLNKEADKLWGPFRFLKTDLLECSLVAVPANPRALAVAKSLDISGDTMAAVFCKNAGHAAAMPNAKPGKPQPRFVRGNPSMQVITGTLSQRIKAAQENYNLLRDRLIDINNKESISDEEALRADELPAEIESTKQMLDRLMRQERAAAFDSEQRTPTVPAEPRQEILPPPRAHFALPVTTKRVEPTDYVYRSLATWSSANTMREPLEKILRDRYQSDEITNIVLKTAVSPAQTTVATWAAELVQIAYGGFLDRLLPKSIYAPLAGAGSRFTFGNFGQIKVPIRTTTSQLSGAWVGEGLAKPVKKASFSSITLQPYKLAIISTFTEEMAQYSTPTIEGIIQQAMQDDTSISLDSYLIDNNASSATRPAGLLNGVTPITPSAASTPAAAMIADLKALIQAIIANGGGSDIIILLNPAQAMGLAFATTVQGNFLFTDINSASQKFNVRFVVSLTQPAGRVTAIDAAEFTTATGDTPRFAVSNEATLHEEDTNPQALSATGTPNTVAAPMRSLFQTDAIAIRMTLYVCWAMRRAGMVQTTNPVIW